MKVVVVIPALNEAETVPQVVGAIPVGVAEAVVVVDGGSCDGTPDRARQAGADVVTERSRGYGRACLAGLRHAAGLGAEVVAFIDAAGAEDPRELPSVLAPIAAGEADLVIGSRVLGSCEKGALKPLQRGGNALATWLIWRRFGHRYTDLGSMRAIALAAFDELGMRELGHGWPIEMQVKALSRGLRVREVPIRYHRRRAGRSKVSGNLVGSLRAGAAILRVALRAA